MEQNWRLSVSYQNQLFRLMARMDSHFICDDQLPADWRELKRHVVRMKDALAHS